MRQRILYILFLVGLTALIAACGAPAATAPSIEMPPTPEHGGVGIRVISAQEWYSEHPEVVASYFGADRSEHYSYLEVNPYKRVLFEGFGFALDYNSPRSHRFAMESTDDTGRYPFRARANCFACKSANYPAVAEYMGIEFYSTPFEELRHLMTQPVSCFNCHGNEPGTPRAVARYVHVAFTDIDRISPSSAACAQCHIEYHFDPVTWEVILPYSGLNSMHPTAALNYFNTVARMPDGRPFADYTNPRSGVRQIKVQHPEFEAVYGMGAPHNSLSPLGYNFSCADCHMPDAESADGVAYRSHAKISPLSNPQLIQGTCAACHVDLYSEVRAIQALYYPAIHGLGNHLADLMERLVLAVESGSHSEATLDEIRYTFRNAQFFWDWAVSENSNGAHNSRLIFGTMEYGWEYAREVEALLQQIGH
ncbi:MAG: ammonia-forming cytochrome c nitrite reductase subunit c552 [Defluviitaleaceae bacterium]|nr:ammonia-forming cytochrome c nitrite reductase subunit c552 [Defluviitaleaceae bacterium]